MRIKLLCVLLITMLFSVNASANVVAPKKSAETPTESTTAFTLNKPSGIPFTVDGNLTIDDNLSTDDNKEFYTVHSKNGAEFFIVIDKAASSNNVYFLNAVDEQDLFNLIEDYQGETTEAETEPPSLENTTISDSAAIPVDTKNNEGSSLPLLIILVAAGVIGVYIFRKKRIAADDEEDEEDDEESNTPEETLSDDVSDTSFTSGKAMDSENNNIGFGDDENNESVFVDTSKTETEFETYNDDNDDEAVDFLEDEEDY